MKIRYEFVDGEISEVEVTEEIGSVIVESRRLEDNLARMSYVQSNELWNSAVAVTDVIRSFSKKVNHIKDELQGDHSHEN